MGLDMFLSKRKNNELDNIYYWRKANQIRHHFVNAAKSNGFVIDNNEYEIKLDDLIDLEKKIKKVLNNKNLASNVLPVQQGFFFGSYDYDNYYFEQLKDTLKEIPSWIKMMKNGDVLIYSEWY